MTALQEALFDFIATFKLYAAYLNIVLGADLLTERLIVHAKSDASLEELIHERTVHTLYHAEHIGPHEEGFLFYVYGISQPLRLQLALLHHQLPVHMHQVISPWHAQAKVYKYITASVFSQARLVQDIDILHVQIPAVFSSEIFRRLVKTNPGVVYEHSDIVHAWGSFLGVQ